MLKTRISGAAMLAPAALVVSLVLVRRQMGSRLVGMGAAAPA